MAIFAAVQMASGPQLAANLLAAEKLIAKAAAGGAKCVVLPENFALMGMTGQDNVKHAEQPGRGRLQDFLAEQARRHGIWLCGGTIPLVSPDADRVYASCLIHDDQGRLVGRYDKIHLFDVQLIGTDERYNESATIYPGEAVTVVDSPFGRIGIAVCYDLRFPELFRRLTALGAEIVLLPTAFTEPTGRAHWEILLRARAIENLCYFVAAAQGGYHVNGRCTYGHSMLVDPWGSIVAQLKTNTPGVCSGEIKPDFLQSTRKSFPALKHRRLSVEA